MNFNPCMDSRTDIRTTGAVYTPTEVAAAVVHYVSGLVPARTLRALEPSVGDGAFILDLSRDDVTIDYTLVDIDAAAVRTLSAKLPGANKRFVVSDFLRFAIEHKEEGRPPFDLVIGNPPFIRKHNFSAAFRDRLERFAELFDYPLSDLKNSWAAFAVAATEMVRSDDGVVAFVLPYEIMTVEYGQKLLRLLRGRYDRIDLFISRDKAFAAIDQDAVIFVGQKSVEPGDEGLFVSRVESFNRLETENAYRVSDDDGADRSLELNGFLLPAGYVDSLQRFRASASILSDFADSAPGVVSAANEYFILPARDVEKHGLSDHVLPILKKGSLAGTLPIFSSEDFAVLSRKGPCSLLAVRGDFETLDENLQVYIKLGEASKIHERYKCRHRKNWYEVPLVKPELGFFFKRSHSFPRIIVNEAGVYVTDTAYGLRMKGDRTIRGLCFSFYNSLTMLFSEIDGRFYGGGVLELSPTEFRRLPLVYHEPSDSEWGAFLKTHADAEGDASTVLAFGDEMLVSKGKFSVDEMAVMRKAWELIRAHRMRHGRRKA